MQSKLKKFYKPNIINVSFSVLCMGLTWKFILPVIGVAKIIPCRIYETVSRFGLCTINPTDPGQGLNTHYLGFAMGDHLYLILYLVVFGIIVPYTIACAVFLIYFSYIKRIMK